MSRDLFNGFSLNKEVEENKDEKVLLFNSLYKVVQEF